MPPADGFDATAPPPGRKRLGAVSPGTTPKSKRLRYVAYACNECKRRKVKCDGAQPCQRCANDIARCSYNRSSRNVARVAMQQSATGALPDYDDGTDNGDETIRDMTMQMRTVMERVEDLNTRLSSMTAPDSSHTSQQPSSNSPLMQLTEDQRDPNGSVLLAAAVKSQSFPTTAVADQSTVSPEYHGPTSAEFSFVVANQSLVEMGIDAPVQSSEGRGIVPFPALSRNQPVENTLLRSFLAKDPLWKIENADASRYVDMYHNTVGLMYPVANNPHLKTKMQHLFGVLDRARRRGNDGELSSLSELFFSVDTQIIKLQLAIGMVADLDLFGTTLSTTLVQSVRESIDDPLMVIGGLNGISVLVLTALFYYNLDEELKASRYSCLASRRCLEMGLHRQDVLVKHFPAIEDRKEALRVFWSTFTLDRRSSLGQGIAPVIYDSIIDPGLMHFEVDHDYLRVMIPFAKLSGKAWQMSNDFISKDSHAVREEIDYLDYQVSQWQKQIPASLRYHRGLSQIPNSMSNDTEIPHRFYLSVVLFVRTNQLRNVIYRPLLQSAARTKSNPAHTLAALNIAKDSLQAFAELLKSTNILQKHSTFFKHFIISSLGNLLLIVVHTTNEYRMEIQEMLNLASMLLRKLGAQSGPISQIWDRLKGFEDLQAKISTARRLKGEGRQQILRGSMDALGSGPGDVVCNHSTSLDVEESMLGQNYMLFDSQIRDEFAGLFDPNFDNGDSYDNMLLYQV